MNHFHTSKRTQICREWERGETEGEVGIKMKKQQQEVSIKGREICESERSVESKRVVLGEKREDENGEDRVVRNMG